MRRWLHSKSARELARAGVGLLRSSYPRWSPGARESCRQVARSRCTRKDSNLRSSDSKPDRLSNGALCILPGLCVRGVCHLGPLCLAPAIPIAAAHRLYDVGIRLSRRSEASRPSSGSRRLASVRRQPLTLERIPTWLKGLTFGSPCRKHILNRDQAKVRTDVVSTRVGRWADSLTPRPPPRGRRPKLSRTQQRWLRPLPFRPTRGDQS